MKRMEAADLEETAALLEQLVIGERMGVDIGVYFDKEIEGGFGVCVQLDKQIAEDDFFEMEFTGETLHDAIKAAAEFCNRRDDE